MKTALLAGHLIAASVFVGGVVFLAVAAVIAKSTLDESSRTRFFRRTGRAFGALGGAAMAILVLTGAYMAVEDIAAWSALVDTAFGRILLQKMVLVVLVTGLVVFHGTVQAPRLRRLRERRLREGSDESQVAEIRKREIAAGIVNGAILVLALAILVEAARLAS